MELKFDKKTLRRLLLCALGIIAVYWVLHDGERVKTILSGVMSILTPFIVGSVLAFILNVPLRAFEGILKGIKNDKLRRVVALILTLICFAIIVTVVLLLLIPQLRVTITHLGTSLPNQVMTWVNHLIDLLDRHPTVQNWLIDNIKLESFDWSSLVDKGLNLLGNSISVLVPQAVNVIGGIVKALFNGFISIAFAIYALFQKETLARQGRKVIYSILPEKTADYIVKVLRLTNSTFSNFLSGQCVEVCILGSLFAITMAIFNLGREYIALISVLVAVTAFIPVVGAWTGCIVGGFLIMVSSSFIDALWFVVLSIVVQQVENNFIYPRVVGTSIGLSGMWVLVAVAIGGQIGGVVGMFLMIPVTSVVYVLIREAVQNRLGKIEVSADKLEPQPPELRSHIREKRAHKKLIRLHKKQSKDTNKK